MPSFPDLYRLSFTAASFKLKESVRIAELYGQLPDWQAVQKKLVSDDALQLGRNATIIRESRELIHRLKQLQPEELDYLTTADTISQRQLLMVAICRTYPFVRQFIIDVVRSKYLRFDLEITEADYRRYVTQQALLHTELEALSPSTLAKLRQVIYQILEGAGYIISTRQKIITAPVVLDSLKDLIRRTSPVDLPLFLLSDREL